MHYRPYKHALFISPSENSLWQTRKNSGNSTSHPDGFSGNHANALRHGPSSKNGPKWHIGRPLKLWLFGFRQLRPRLCKTYSSYWHVVSMKEWGSLFNVMIQISPPFPPFSASKSLMFELSQSYGQARHRPGSPAKKTWMTHMRVSINGDTPIAGWFLMENPTKIRMMTGGTPMT